MAFTAPTTNLPAISAATTGATALANLVLVSPQNTIGYQPTFVAGKNPGRQPPSLLFHYEGEQSVTIQSDITDHFIQDNSAIQDQCALKPEKITTHGFIGELNNVPPRALQILQQASQKLTTISAYTPGLSATALLAYNEAFLLYQTGANAVDSAVSSWSSITGGGGENVIGFGGQGNSFDPATATVTNNQSKQQVAFQQLYGYWRNRWVFTVQTPWAVFQNMMIENLRAIQDESTRMITDFEVTFKMIRTAATKTFIGTGRFLSQSTADTSLGVQTGTPDIPATTGIANTVGH